MPKTLVHPGDPPLDVAGLKQMAAQIRHDIVYMTHAAQAGHPGGKGQDKGAYSSAIGRGGVAHGINLGCRFDAGGW